MSEDRDFCAHHERNCLRLDMLEKEVGNILDEIKGIIANHNSMTLTIARIEIMFQEIKNSVSDMIKRQNDAKKGLLYPLVVGIVMAALGFVAGKL